MVCVPVRNCLPSYLALWDGIHWNDVRNGLLYFCTSFHLTVCLQLEGPSESCCFSTKEEYFQLCFRLQMKVTITGKLGFLFWSSKHMYNSCICVHFVGSWYAPKLKSDVVPGNVCKGNQLLFHHTIRAYLELQLTTVFVPMPQMVLLPQYAILCMVPFQHLTNL